MRIFLFVLAMLAAGPAAAHKQSDAYLVLQPGDDGRVAVQWDIALRDLEAVIGLDTDGDGAITWGELRAQHGAIATHALARLELSAGGQGCAIGPVTHRVAEHSDGNYAVLSFLAQCGPNAGRLRLNYRLLAEFDTQHRGLVSVQSPGGIRTFVLGPAAPQVEIDLAQGGGVDMAAFFIEGIGHILGGFDHLFFLAVLLLPAMLTRTAAGWTPVPRFGAGVIETVKVLSAFSVAHTLTVALAAAQLVDPPSRVIEAAIALTIVLTALDLLVPFIGRRRWPVAGAFGLIHGFGFAGALGPLALPPLDLVVALVGFNLGVEAGQLLIALPVLPLIYLLGRHKAYPRYLMPAASVTAIAVGTLWFLERAFDLPAGWRAVLPF
jgi:hypothetical protein